MQQSVQVEGAKPFSTFNRYTVEERAISFIEIV
jgi:hypothetical protein